MKTRYIIATVLLIIGFIIHTIGGELTDIKSLLLSEISDAIKIEIRAVWYLVSLDFLVSGIFMIVILIKRITSQSHLLIDFIGIRMLLYGLIFLLLVIFSNNKSLFQVPQWILLISIGTLLEWGKLVRLFKK